MFWMYRTSSSVISLSALVVTGVGMAFGGCALPTSNDEDEPIDTRDNIAEQGLMDCTERSDTGYSHGTAFAISVVTVDGKPAEVDTANAYWVMQQAAAADGVGIRIVSGFRTMEQQEYFYGCYTNCNCNSCNLAASPGYSNHQSGHALDLNTSDAGVLSWLNAHGAAFGFSRTVPSEAWHWEWWGGGPGGGLCGVSPECLADANYGGCNGSVITRCDDTNQVGSGDCGAFGAACSVEGGSPHCVHPYCSINLNGEETGTYCSDATKLATCNLGVLTEGDCGAQGGTCSEGGGSAHCVHFMCLSNLSGGEEGSFCVEGSNQVGSCALGVYTETECGADTTCTAAAGAASCLAPGQEPSAGEGEGEDEGKAQRDEGEAENDDITIGTKSYRSLPPSVQHGCAQTSGAPMGLALLLLASLRRRARRSGTGTRTLTLGAIVVVAGISLAGCANELAADEDEPLDDRANELLQGVYDCAATPG